MPNTAGPETSGTTRAERGASRLYSRITEPPCAPWMLSCLIRRRSAGLPERTTPATVLVKSSRGIGRDETSSSMSRA